MRILFISANTEKINILPMPLGLAYVAAAAQNKGHDVRVLDLMAHPDSRLPIRNIARSFSPDVIGISVRNIDDQNMTKPKFLLDAIREIVLDCRSVSDAVVVLGGAGFSIFPDAVLAYLEADMGIQGEGEEAFPELLDKLTRGADLAGTPGLYLKGRGLQGKRVFVRNLDRLPVAGVERFLSAYDGELWIPFQTRRGCPMNCSYCSTAAIEGRAIRKRSPKAALQEMKAFVASGFDRFYFVDNTFNLPPGYAKEICRLMIREGLPIAWRCILYPAKVDEELVALMAEAGCREISLGFESGCERILKNMNKRFNPEQVQRTSHLLAKYAIRQMGFLMLGGPGETRESVLESLAFADSLPLDTVKVSQGIRVYPHTPLAKTAAAEGRVPAGADLLMPTFYMVSEIERWLMETVTRWMAGRPHWIT